MAPVPGKFVQISPLVQQQSGVLTSFLVALDINGLLWLLHIPWQGASYQEWVTTPFIQQAALPVVPGWTPLE